MSEALWTASILEGIRARLAARLETVLGLIADDGGETVAAPKVVEVRRNIDDAGQLPGVFVQTSGETESEFLMPAAYRLHIPLRVTSIVAPEANPTDPDLAARTYNRGVINVLTETDTVTDIDGLFFVGGIESRIEEAGEGARKWRRFSIVEATLYVATTRERT